MIESPYFDDGQQISMLIIASSGFSGARLQNAMTVTMMIMFAGFAWFLHIFLCCQWAASIVFKKNKHGDFLAHSYFRIRAELHLR